MEVHECIVKARNNGTTTKCIDFIPPFLMLISDIDSDHAWIRIEEFDLTKDHRERKSFRIHKKEQEYLFNILIAYYNKLWG